MRKRNELSIMSPSMGGLISRYALRYMEQKGMNHNTKLWISFDSPHLGANINIGDQILFTRISGLPSPDSKDGINQLKSVACKQLMIHHYTRLLFPTPGDDPRIIRGHAFHEQFFQEINSMGFPQNVCRVALVNGMTNGTKQDNFPTDECGKTFQFTRTPSLIQFLPSLVRRYFVRSSPSFNNECDVFRVQTNLLFDVQVNTVKGNGQRSSLDGLQGGYYEINDLIASGISKLPNVFYTNFFNRQCFIPTASSLALRNPNINWGLSLLSKLNSTDTPFDSIYAPPTANEDHVQITAASVNYIKSKLNSINCN